MVQDRVTWKRTSIVCVFFIAHGFSPSLFSGNEKNHGGEKTHVSLCQKARAVPGTPSWELFVPSDKVFGVE
jgi:hypothetical protein